MKTKQEKLQELIDKRNPLNPLSKMIENVTVMKGDPGEPGEPGYTPVKGVDYYTAQEIDAIVSYIQSNVKQGPPGEKGDSIKGDTGYSPKKGVDFWTTKDQEKIIRDVLGKIPTPKENKPINVDEIIQTVKNSIPQVNYKDEIGKILNTPGMRMLLHGGGISDAPIDHKQYARKDGTWTEVVGGAGGQVNTVVAGTGISVNSTDPVNPIVTNTAPDQIVSITAGTNITSVTGTYPNFTINAATQGGSYTLPTASASVLGGIKVGSGLSIDGAGVLTVTTGGSGTVTSVAALTLGTTGTDLSSTVTNPTTTPVITLNVPTASATNRGALSAADWTTFNNKGNGTWTDSSTNTGTNKTLNSLTNYIDADAVHIKSFLNLGSSSTVGMPVYSATWNIANSAVEVSKARANSAITCPCVGLCESALSDGSVIEVRTQGILNNVNTNAWSEGTDLYVSATTAGTLTSTKPSGATEFTQRVAKVIRQHATLGVLEVNIDGFTDLSILRGINTGDETQATIKTKLGAASAGADGYLTGTDWSTFNSKQPAGSYLTSLTGAALLAGGNTFTGSQTFDTSTLFVDSVNHRVGIGTVTPGRLLDVKATLADAKANIHATGTASVAAMVTQNDTDGNYMEFGSYGSTSGASIMGVDAQGAESLYFVPKVGSLGIIGTGNASDLVLGSNQAEVIRLTSSGKVNITGLIASKLVFTDSSKNLTSTGIGTSSQFLKADGSVDSTTYGQGTVTGTGTLNELSYWTGANSQGTLPVATYPSLTEVSYVKGVTSSIQTQLGTKAPTTSPTFATSINGSYLTASQILATDASKNIVSLAIATYPSLTELTYVKGVTSAIQTQFTGKAATNQTMNIGTTAVAINRASAALVLTGITSIDGTATNLSGTPALPNGTTATTQSANDNSTKIATTAYADLHMEKTGGAFTGKVTDAGRDEVGKTYTPATGAQTVALDCSVNNMHIVSGNSSGTAITFTITGATNSQPFIVSILQGGTTVSTITAWFATIRWAGGTAPTLTATLNKRDTFGFIRTGANTYDGFIIGQNA